MWQGTKELLDRGLNPPVLPDWLLYVAIGGALAVVVVESQPPFGIVAKVETGGWLRRQWHQRRSGGR